MDPEAMRGRDLRIADIGGDIQVRTAAIVRKADAAACIHAQVLAGDGQARRAHGPARAITP